MKLEELQKQKVSLKKEQERIEQIVMDKETEMRVNSMKLKEIRKVQRLSIVNNEEKS